MTYVVVKLHGGPRDGKYVKYGAPLPNTLVFAEWNESKGICYNDYQRSGTKDYRWVDPKNVERQGHETTLGPA